jgi:hypothetical protein
VKQYKISSAAATDIMKVELQDFFSEFTFMCNQPNSVALEQILRREFKFLSALSSGADMFNSLSHALLSWLSDRQQCVLKAIDFEQIVAAGQGDLERYYLLGGTKEFERECKAFPLQLDSLINKSQSIIDFLRKPESCSSVLVLYGHRSVGKHQLVHMAISSVRAELEWNDASWCFCVSDATFRDKLSLVLAGDAMQCFVLECSSNHAGQVSTSAFASAIAQSNHLQLNDPSKWKRLILLYETDDAKAPNIQAVLTSDLNPNQELELKFEHVLPLTPSELQTLLQKEDDKISLPSTGGDLSLQRILNQGASGLARAISRLDLLASLLFATQRRNYADAPADLYEELKLTEAVKVYRLRDVISRAQPGPGHHLLLLSNTLSQTTASTLRAACSGSDTARARVLPMKDVHSESETETEKAFSKDASLQQLLHRFGGVIDPAETLVIIGDAGHFQSVLSKYPGRVLWVADRSEPSVADAAANYAMILCHCESDSALDVHVVMHSVPGTNTVNPTLLRTDDIALQPVTHKTEITHELSDHAALFPVQATGLHIMIVSDAGSGKSCTLQHLAAMPRVHFDWHISIALPSITTGLVSLQTYISTTLSTIEVEALLYDLQADGRGRVLLLLDSWDEVKEEHYSACDAFFASIPSHVTCILTTRSYKADAVPLSFPFHRHIQLQPFSEPQQRSYMTAYFKAVNTAASDEDVQLFVHRVLLLLKASRISADEIGLPLQTSMLCDLLRVDFERWTENAESAHASDLLSISGGLTKSTLYQRFVQLKVQEWLRRQLRLPKTHVWPPVAGTQLRLVYVLAHELLRLLQLAAVQHLFPDFPVPSATVSRIDELRTELLDLGIVTALDTAAKQTVRCHFLHQTFAEYLSAAFICSQLGQSLKADHVESVDQLLSAHKFFKRYRVVWSFLFEQLHVQYEPLVSTLKLSSHFVATVNTNFHRSTDLVGVYESLADFCHFRCPPTQQPKMLERISLTRLSFLHHAVAPAAEGQSDPPKAFSFLEAAAAPSIQVQVAPAVNLATILTLTAKPSKLQEANDRVTAIEALGYHIEHGPVSDFTACLNWLIKQSQSSWFVIRVAAVSALIKFWSLGPITGMQPAALYALEQLSSDSLYQRCHPQVRIAALQFLLSQDEHRSRVILLKPLCEVTQSSYQGQSTWMAREALNGLEYEFLVTDENVIAMRDEFLAASDGSKLALALAHSFAKGARVAVVHAADWITSALRRGCAQSVTGLMDALRKEIAVVLWKQHELATQQMVAAATIAFQIKLASSSPAAAATAAAAASVVQSTTTIRAEWNLRVATCRLLRLSQCHTDAAKSMQWTVNLCVSLCSFLDGDLWSGEQMCALTSDQSMPFALESTECLQHVPLLLRKLSVQCSSETHLKLWKELHRMCFSCISKQEHDSIVSSFVLSLRIAANCKQASPTLKLLDELALLSSHLLHQLLFNNVPSDWETFNRIEDVTLIQRDLNGMLSALQPVDYDSGGHLLRALSFAGRSFDVSAFLWACSTQTTVNLRYSTADVAILHTVRGLILNAGPADDETWSRHRVLTLALTHQTLTRKWEQYAGANESAASQVRVELSRFFDHNAIVSTLLFTSWSDFCASRGSRVCGIDVIFLVSAMLALPITVAPQSNGFVVFFPTEDLHHSLCTVIALPGVDDAERVRVFAAATNRFDTLKLACKVDDLHANLSPPAPISLPMPVNERIGSAAAAVLAAAAQPAAAAAAPHSLSGHKRKASITAADGADSLNTDDAQEILKKARG